MATLAGCGGGGGAPAANNSDPIPPPEDPAAGLDRRPLNASCVAPAKAGGPSTIELVDAFPDMAAFAAPLGLFQAPGDNRRWFAMERDGFVRVFDNVPGVATRSTFIDIESRVSTSGEGGLLGMAFHPDFAVNGQVFLSYTRPGLVSVVARFRSLDGGLTLDPNNPEVIIEIDQDFSNHNGGSIAFGPDGYLYMGLGDGGSGGDPNDRAQDRTNLLGNMLRLDVDGGVPYAIPTDNPYFGNGTCAADHSSNTNCPEIYAWGFRNPWRWSFDTATGELWLGDVGQGSWEEVDIVELGGNYGWDCREGAHNFNNSAASCATVSGLIEPVAEYNHSEGNSITGGFVYRGDIVALQGQYIFGDYGSGRIWRLVGDGQGGYSREELLDTSLGLASFAQDTEGEIYALDIFGGRVYKFAEGAGGGGGAPVPMLLSDTGCVDGQDPTQPDAGLIPYEPNAAFWSDGAVKERWLGLPDAATIAVGGDGDFSFPNGTVLMKHFRLAGQLIETRLFMRHPDGDWAGYTYEWNAQQTDATLVIGGKTATINGQDWVYPSGTQCQICHTQAAGFSLGLETAQLNRDLTYPTTGRSANQLRTLDEIMMFSAPLGDPANLPVLADPGDAGGDLDARARAYLHTNCAGCHRPGGPPGRNLDLRYQTDLADTNTCDIVPIGNDLGITNARVIAPGEPDRSVLVGRMNRRDVNAMPPLASTRVDSAGVALISDWIESLASCP
jgi:uncharacterized repeat protein (TIGR03806 family)